MKDVFRIKERFEITERGTVFALEKNKDATIQEGDILADLWGNRFKVKEIERLRRMPDGRSLENMPTGIVLINTPDEYRTYHLLPEWYADFEEETAKSVWEEQGSLENALEMTKALEGAYVVKDYVKSRKHEWYDACYIKNIANKNNTSKVIGNFIERQGASLVGGIVLRKFEHLMRIGFHEKSGMPLSEEYRVFIYVGRILNIQDYWTEKTDVKISEEEKHWLEEIAHKVKSNFVAVDIARKANGSLMILEFGDGQVSGLQQMDAMGFYEAFDAK